MSENLLLISLTALLNGAVTWGIVKTQLAWLRRDVDLAHDRITKLHALFDYATGRRRFSDEDREI